MQSIADVINAVNEILYGVHLFISTSTQAIMLTFGHNTFGKRTVCNLQTRIQFNKTSRYRLDKIVDQLFLSKSIPNVRFNFTTCHEICK